MFSSPYYDPVREHLTNESKIFQLRSLQRFVNDIRQDNNEQQCERFRRKFFCHVIVYRDFRSRKISLVFSEGPAHQYNGRT